MQVTTMTMMSQTLSPTIVEGLILQLQVIQGTTGKKPSSLNEIK